MSSLPNPPMSRDINDRADEDTLPSDVNSKEQLSLLPEKYLSDDPKRPLLLTIDGQSFKYALKPLYYSAAIVLIIELFERLAFYGINNTQTEFLTGGYNPNWSPDMQPVVASSYTQLAYNIAYAAPFLGGIVADGWLGDFWGIVTGVVVFYLPGLLLIALSVFPYLLGSTFPTTILKIGFLGLMPIGTGFIKSLVNVFGAKQFHPLLQAPQISSYYTLFYVIINIGSLIATFVVPTLAHKSLEIAYFIPFVSMSVGFLIFVSFSARYVKRPPEKKALFSTLGLLGKRVGQCKSMDLSKESNGGNLNDTFVDGVKRLLLVVPVTGLIIPFSMVYNQMNTVFVLQGQAMKAAGYFDESFMSVFDTIACILMGVFAGSFLYPTLTKRGIHLPLTYRYAIGSCFAALAMLSGIILDSVIRSRFNNHNGERISVFWIAFSYFLVGMGEVLANSAAYEATFAIAPKEQKGLASAINLFMMGSMSGFICNGIQAGASSWFPVYPHKATDLEKTQAYVDSNVNSYYWILFAVVLIFGVGLNLLPPVKNWVERIVVDAQDATRIEFSTLGGDHCNDAKDLSDNEEAIDTSSEEGDNEDVKVWDDATKMEN